MSLVNIEQNLPVYSSEQISNKNKKVKVDWYLISIKKNKYKIFIKI